jgi:GDPmannose 4,6-dehydratase
MKSYRLLPFHDLMVNREQNRIAIVTGANGQDGYFLTERLLRDGWFVHATTRELPGPDFEYLSGDIRSHLQVHQIDLAKPQPLFDLIRQTQPEELYNLAGQSSVSKSFLDPLYTWQTNTESVVHLLECLRKHSPHTRFYQASSTDMFGIPPGGAIVFDEDSALNPQSPYASAKAAAHLLCHSYREVYGLRITSGILSNHESHRRPASFLSRKVVEHVSSLNGLSESQIANSSPLAVGNLKIRRDWGFAPDYVEGMCRILRQIKTRAEMTGQAPKSDEGANYRDYVLATGETHPVWELIDSAFTISGFDLEWDLEGNDPAAWCGYFRSTKRPAVTVSPDLLRTAEPLVIRVDPSRAQKELGWVPRQGLEVFLRDMFDKVSDRKAGPETAYQRAG